MQRILYQLNMLWKSVTFLLASFVLGSMLAHSYCVYSIMYTAKIFP